MKLCFSGKLGLIGIATGLAGIAYAGYVHLQIRKTNKIVKNILADKSEASKFYDDPELESFLKIIR